MAPTHNAPPIVKVAKVLKHRSRSAFGSDLHRVLDVIILFLFSEHRHSTGTDIGVGTGAADKGRYNSPDSHFIPTGFQMAYNSMHYLQRGGV